MKYFGACIFVSQPEGGGTTEVVGSEIYESKTVCEKSTKRSFECDEFVKRCICQFVNPGLILNRLGKTFFLWRDKKSL